MSETSNNDTDREGPFPFAKVDEQADGEYLVTVRRSPHRSTRFRLRPDEVGPVVNSLRSVDTEDDNE